MLAWAKKNHEVHYGYENHAKVDAKSKLANGFATTPASVHIREEGRSTANRGKKNQKNRVEGQL